MLKRLLLGLLPGVVVAVAAAAIVLAIRFKFLANPAWTFIWMVLVAVLFLVLGSVAFAARAYRWIIPAAVGFVVQSVGVTLCYLEIGFTSPVEPLVWFTIPAVLVALLGLLAAWVVTLLRARSLERRMLEGADASGADPQKLAKIREDMKEALGTLRRAGGRGAVYELPWFLVIGRSAVGKTVAISNSGLAFPRRRDRVKGVGGTTTCDWFFTNEMIFLDTPGKWSMEVMDDGDRKYWMELLGLLRRFRGRRPLDGIVVVVPADELLVKDEQDIRDQAGLIREVIDLLQTELGFRFPVYLVVSKCDLVDGFVDFFRALPPQRREEMLGWANEDPNRGRVGRKFERGFEGLVHRLGALRLEMLAAGGSVRRARRILFFVEEFKRLQPNLAAFVGDLFRRDPYQETPVFRGFFCTSGLQGQGTPVGPAMAELARHLGVRLGPETGDAEKGERSFFLLDLFRRLMIADEGLVDRSAGYRWRHRRYTLVAALAPALVGLVLLLPAPLALLVNRHVYRTAAVEVPRAMREIEGAPNDASGATIQYVLERTERIRALHYKMTGPQPYLRWLWMRQPGALAEVTFQAFRDAYVDRALNPTLRQAEAFVTADGVPEESAPTCSERVEVLNSVIWLERARFAASPEKIGALGVLWHLSGDDDGGKREVLDRFMDQFRHLRKSPGVSEDLLREFSLSDALEAIQRDCGKQIAAPPLGRYRRFQDQCRGVRRTDRTKAQACYEQLTGILLSRTEDQEQLARTLGELRENVGSLAQDGRNAEARRAHALVKDLVPATTGADGCEEAFRERVVPALLDYTADDKAVIRECREKFGRQPNVQYPEGRRFLEEKALDLEEKGKSVQDAFESFSADCGGKAKLEVGPLRSTVDAYRHQECLPLDDAQAAGGPSGGGGPSPVERPPLLAEHTASDGFIRVGHRPAPPYRLPDVQRRAEEWRGKLGAYPEESTRFAREISAYGNAMQGEWKAYLRSLRVIEGRGPDTASWLDELADTTDFQRAIDAAVTHTDASSLPPDAPFLSYKASMEVFQDLRGFVGGSLGEYQDKLKAIAKDLRECHANPAFCRDFRAKVKSGDDTASLVAARAWVRRYAGAVVEGSLTQLLLGPLNVAETALFSQASVGAQWNAMTALFQSTAAGRFPIAPAASEELTTEAAGRLFGASTGAIPGLLAQGAGAGLSGAQTAWLERAGQVAKGLCGDGDGPTPLPIALTIHPPRIEGEKFAKDYVAIEVLVVLGGTDPVSWKRGDPLDAKPQEIEILGDRARRNAEVKVVVAKRESKANPLNWGPKEDLKDPETIVLDAVRDKPWAPLRLILAGTSGPPQKKSSLRYEHPLPGKDGERGGKIVLEIDAEGSRLPALLGLLQHELESPPAGGN